MKQQTDTARIKKMESDVAKAQKELTKLHATFDKNAKLQADRLSKITEQMNALKKFRADNPYPKNVKAKTTRKPSRPSDSESL